MTSADLSQIQNPVRVLWLRDTTQSIASGLTAIVLVAKLSGVAFAQLGQHEQAAFKTEAERFSELSAELQAERAKPNIVLRSGTFKTYDKDRNVTSARPWWLFKSAVPDFLMRQLVAYWLGGSDDNEFITEPAHTYRNDRHALITMRITKNQLSNASK